MAHNYRARVVLLVVGVDNGGNEMRCSVEARMTVQRTCVADANPGIAIGSSCCCKIPQLVRIVPGPGSDGNSQYVLLTRPANRAIETLCPEMVA